MNRLFLTAFFSLPYFLFAQVYQYTLDLNQVSGDQLIINLTVPPLSEDTVKFHFPKTIPGTYATQDYGKYISAFQARNEEGRVLPVVQTGTNTFEISGAKNLTDIRYKVDDTFDAKVRKDKVFEPAGTNIQSNLNFVFNHAGFFGFFEGTEDWPVELSIYKPSHLYGVSALEYISTSPAHQKFKARSYHHLIDCPIMFSEPDTTSFYVANTRVEMSVFSENGRELSKQIQEDVKVYMEAVATFLEGDLPVDRYTFLFYIKDYADLGPTFEGEATKVRDYVKLARELIGQGFGALEHGNSSFYFLPDFGNDMIFDQIRDVVLHEFLHILTPLNLHSERIGSFDYVDPKMSRHLWLYEGITEYFDGISKVKGGIISPYEYLSQTLKSKITTARNYPQEKMSFTEMSENVLENPWKREYLQVYQRGALLGALLDIEIMRLTQGEKTLRDVVVKLSKQYGPERSVPEDSLIQIFVAEVHPGLQTFFDQYIEGRVPLDITKLLSPAGVIYQESFVGPAPRNPFLKEENDIKSSRSLLQNEITIEKIGEGEWAGLMEGDVGNPDQIDALMKNEYGDWLPEGTAVSIEITRNGETTNLSFPIQYIEKTVSDQLFILEGMNPSEALIFRRWLSNDSLDAAKRYVQEMDED